MAFLEHRKLLSVLDMLLLLSKALLELPSSFSS